MLLLSPRAQAVASNTHVALRGRRLLVCCLAALFALFLLRPGSVGFESVELAARTLPLAAAAQQWLPKAARRLPQLKSLRRPATVFVAPLEVTSKRIPAVAYDLEHARLPLAQFLKAHVGSPLVKPQGRAVWFTLGDATYVRKAVSHMAIYLAALPPRAALPTHDLVVLCIDVDCIEASQAIGVLGYGGFVDDAEKPEFVRPDTWAKANGLAQALEAGYHVVFADADVFFKHDVFDHMKPLDDPTFDIQIQDESHRGHVNTGFWIMRASKGTAELWREVATRVAAVGARDQAKINDLLGSENLRRPGREHGYESEFTSLTGLRVEVLPSHFFWGLHHAWQVPHRTTFLHATCCETEALKLYLAASAGFLQDVDGLYSRPPRVLTLGSALSGTQDDMSRFLRLLLAAAAAADRALVPPLSGILLDRPHPEDGTLRETALTADEGDAIVGHQRFLWSLVDVTPLLADNATVRLLEPSYTTHATPHLLATGDTAMLAALHDPVDLDLRFLWKFDQLVEHLLAPPFRDAQVVRLITDEGPRGFWSRWAEWTLPEATPELRPCWEPRRVATCAALCRWPPLEQ